MFEVVTSYAPVLVAFVLGTLVPRIYESVLNVFFHMPDQFLKFVNTTLVPRFGDNGGKIVLAIAQTAVMIAKQFLSMLVTVAKNVFPLVLRVVESIYDTFMYFTLGEYIGTFLRGFWNELTLFFSWTTSAFKHEFTRFTFHLLMLYVCLHVFVWGIKRMLKKVL